MDLLSYTLAGRSYLRATGGPMDTEETPVVPVEDDAAPEAAPTEDATV